MRKVLAVLVAAVAVVLLFTAGGGRDDSPASGPVTLRGMHWTSSTVEQERVNARFEVFTRQFPDIKIDFQWFPQGYAERLTALFAANDAPDIFACYVGDLGVRAKSGFMQPLTPFFNRDGFNRNDDLMQNAVITFQGDIYGIVHVLQPQILFYNKDHFDKAGVPYPTDNWTWRDMQEAARRMTITEGGRIVQYGFQYDEYCRLWTSHFQSNGGQAFDNRDMPTRVNFNNDLGIESAQYLYDLVQSLNVSPPPGVVGVLGHRDSFANGLVSMILDGSWMNTQFAQMEGLNYGVGLVPMGRTTRGGWIAPTIYTMSSTTKYPEQVWTFLKWWWGYENSMFISGYGNALDSAGMPVWKSAYRDPAWKPDANVTNIGRMVEYSVPDMTFQYFGTWYWDTLNAGLQEMVGNKIDPRTAMNTISQRTQRDVLDEIER